MASSSSPLLSATASSTSAINNATDSGLDDEDTSNESTTVDSLYTNKDDLDSEDDHTNPPPAPPTSPTIHHSHTSPGALSPLGVAEEFQTEEAEQPLVHRPFHMGRLDLDRVGEMEMEVSEPSKIWKSDEPIPSLFPGNFNAPPSLQNSCKALIKFEFPMEQLPNLVCQYQQDGSRRLPSLHTEGHWPQSKSGLSNYYGSLHIDTSYKDFPSASRNVCNALVPYHRERILGYKDRVYRRPVSIRFRDNWSNLRKEHTEQRLRNASNSGNTDLVKRLLQEQQVNPNGADESGRTPLHLAACKGFGEIIDLLLEAGASPNKKDTLGNTPLHLAACTNHFNVVTRLLKAGTDISTVDKHGRNPLQLAKAKLRVLAMAKSDSAALVKVKKEVGNIIEMMMEYLKKKGEVDEVEMLEDFYKLSLGNESGDRDFERILLNLAGLNLKQEEQV